MDARNLHTMIWLDKQKRFTGSYFNFLSHVFNCYSYDYKEIVNHDSVVIGIIFYFHDNYKWNLKITIWNDDFENLDDLESVSKFYLNQIANQYIANSVDLSTKTYKQYRSLFSLNLPMYMLKDSPFSKVVIKYIDNIFLDERKKILEIVENSDWD